MASQSTSLCNHLQTINQDHLESNGLPFDSPNKCLDLPPESFWVPEADEREWFDSNTVFVQRKGSIKLVSIASGSNHHTTQFSNTYTNRNTNPTVIGLFKPHKAASAEEISWRNRAARADMLRSRSEPGGDLLWKGSEPGSPRVSCMGRVKSKKNKKLEKTGFWTGFGSALKTGFGSKQVINRKTNNNVS